jgi:hypothetical protein
VLLILFGFAALSPARGQTPLPSSAPGWSSVREILGPPTMEGEAFFKADFPRTDLNVVVRGVPLEPEGLGSWFLLRFDGKSTRLTGDIVLLDTEVPKAMAQALRNGLEVTALYSPFLNESPGIKRLCLQGRGARSSLAWAAKLILSSTGTPLGVSDSPSGPKDPVATGSPTKNSHPPLDWSKIQDLLGPGEMKGRTLRFKFPALEDSPVTGTGTPAAMENVTTFLFQKLEGGHLAAMGTFVLGKEDVDAVMETLIRGHITVTSLWNLGSKEEPRFFFLNFWAEGGEAEVTEALKDALDQAGLAQEP